MTMTDSFLKTKWGYWACQSFGWGGVAALGWMMNGIQRLSAAGSQPTQDNYFLPLTCIAGFFATHFLRSLIKNGKWLEMQRSALALRYALALVVITLALTHVRKNSGTALGLLGLVQFIIAAITSVFVGTINPSPATAMLMIGGTVVAIAVVAGFCGRRALRRDPDPATAH